METVRCNSCGSTEFSELYTLPDYLLERPDVFATLVKCRQCGLIYQNPRPSIAEMSQHYPENYEPYETKEEQKTSWLFQKAIKYGIAKRVRFVTKYKKNGRVLDVGCATGVFLEGMRARGKWELYGVEPSDHAATIAFQKTNADIFVGTLEQAQFSGNFFDVVTMWDVLEHVHNPQETLDEIYRILKPDGLLVIRVPNVDSLQAKIFGRFWAGLDAPRHLYVFSPEDLSNMLRKSGFQIKNKSFGSASYLVFSLSLRFWMVEKGIQKSVRQGILWILNHPVSRLISAPFFYLTGFLDKGPLLVVTAHRTK